MITGVVQFEMWIQDLVYCLREFWAFVLIIHTGRDYCDEHGYFSEYCHVRYLGCPNCIKADLEGNRLFVQAGVDYWRSESK
jgi:hypothetical protein